MVNPGKNFFEKKILPYGRNRAGLMNVKYEARSRRPCLASNALLRTKSFVGQLSGDTLETPLELPGKKKTCRCRQAKIKKGLVKKSVS